MTTTWRIAVLGLGTMGAGIARVLARAGHEVRAFDARPGVADEVAATLGASPGTSLADAVRDADLVVEVVTEDLAVKHALLAEVEAACDATIASNSSTFTPSQLAEHLADPGRLVVAHFFNPADAVPLVEVVPHPESPQATVDAVVALLADAGKHPVPLAREVDGLVGNRLQAALVREAMHLVEQGIATPAQVDDVVTHGLGPRWAAVGPFRVMELGGIEVWNAVADRLFPTLGDASEAPAMLRDARASGRFDQAAQARDDAADLDRIRSSLERR